jgi:hypothetical protein
MWSITTVILTESVLLETDTRARRNHKRLPLRCASAGYVASSGNANICRKKGK